MKCEVTPIRFDETSEVVDRNVALRSVGGQRGVQVKFITGISDHVFCLLDADALEVAGAIVAAVDMVLPEVRQ
jgi:hypothetical protein